MLDKNNKKNICIISATPLTIQFFFLPHIKFLNEHFNVSLAFDCSNDSYLPMIEMANKRYNIRMARKVNIFRDFCSLIDLFYLFRRVNFDAIITVAPKAGFLGMVVGTVCRIPVRVHIFQGEPWASMKGLRRYFFKLLDKVTAFLSTSLLAVSHSEKEFLVSESVINAKKISILGDGSIAGVDQNRFTMNFDIRKKIRLENNIPPDAVVMVFMGRLNPDKGVQELLQAFDLVSKVRSNVFMMIIGPDETNGTNLIWPPDSIQYIRSVGFTLEPEKFLMAADFLCLPSYREGFPVSILEAAAIGLPSIGTRIYGVVDAIIDGETGILIEPRNIKELFNAMLELIDNSPRRIAMGTAARQRVLDKFSSKEVIMRYVTYFKTCLSSS